MKNFNVLSLSPSIADTKLDIVCCAFAELYYSTTSKHQKRMHLYFIDDNESSDEIISVAKRHNIDQCLHIIDISKQDDIEILYDTSSVFFMPTHAKVYKKVKEALSFGLPILSYECTQLIECIDASCGFLVSQREDAEGIHSFSNYLRILFFDPEAQKIIKAGALQRYNDLFSWKSKSVAD